MAEAKLVVEHREQMWSLLIEAAQYEHMIMCQYLYACFSLKTGPDEGLTAEQADTVARWRETLTGIAIEEMLHLALVMNVMIAIGAAPSLSRPNFPRHSEFLPSGWSSRCCPSAATPLSTSCTWSGRRAWSGWTRRSSSRPRRRPSRARPSPSPVLAAIAQTVSVQAPPSPRESDWRPGQGETAARQR